MKKVYKYPIVITDRQTIVVPLGAEFLCVQMQNNNPCIWALVDVNAQPTTVNVKIYGTGHEVIEDNLQYIGTIQESIFVWHAFFITS